MDGSLGISGAGTETLNRMLIRWQRTQILIYSPQIFFRHTAVHNPRHQALKSVGSYHRHLKIRVGIALKEAHKVFFRQVDNTCLMWRKIAGAQHCSIWETKYATSPTRRTNIFAI